MTKIQGDELQLWARYVRELCGIALDASKGYLLETRLAALMKETGSQSFLDLYQKTKADPSRLLPRKIVNAITTQETSFFRDSSPFELLRHKVIPDLIDRRRKTGVRPLPIRIWSAACATGQEVYSIGILLKELLGSVNDYDVRIFATDISDQAVAQASRGIYSKLDLERGMPEGRIGTYFERHGDDWKIRDEIRALAQFQNLNLLKPFSFPGAFDVVLCRNVAIYFTEPDKITLFRNLGRCLAPGGCLLIGSTESLSGLCPEFEPRRHLRSVFYELRTATESLKR